NYIAVDSGSPDWWTRFRTEISNGTNTRGYYTSDFTSAEFTSKQHTDSGNNSYPVNDWYNLTLVMNTDGSYSYYKDYVLLATYKSNYISTNNGGGLTDEAAASAISSATEYIIGAADTSAYEGYTGKIKNLRIFATSEAKALQLAMINYENKMAEGKVYKNMSAAYNAYVAANKGFDAYVYGGDTSVDIATLANNLNTATDNMNTEWTRAYFNTAKAYHVEDETDDGFSNVVFQRFSDGATNTCWQGRYSSTGFYQDQNVSLTGYTIKLASPINIVLAYDGNANNCYAPLVLELASKSGTSPRFYYLYLNNNTTKFELRQNWKGLGGTWNVFPNDSTTDVISYTNNGTGSPNTNSTGFAWNRLYYKGGGNKTSFVDIGSNFTYKSGTKSSGNSANQGDVYTYTTVYVIDYEAVLYGESLLEGRLGAVSVENYKEGGLTDLIEAMDVFTADDVNPNSYVNGINVGGSTYKYETNYSAAVNKCAERIKNAYDNYRYKIAGTADTSDYANLRSYLTNGLNTKSFPGIENGRALTAQEIYNSSTLNSDILENYDAFETAYENAVAHMAAIPANGYGHTAVASKTVSQLATELSSAYDNLMIKSNIETPTISLFNNDVYLGVNDEINIASTESEAAGTVTYNIYYDVDNTSGAPDRTGSFSFNSNTDVAVFLDNSHNKAIVTAIGTETQGGAQSNIARTTFYRLQDPSFTGIVDVGAIPASGIVALGSSVQATKAATNDSNTITIQYKYGSGEWQNSANGEIPAFEELSGSKYASVNQISIRTAIKNGDDVIAKSEGTASVTLAREADFDIYVESPGSNIFYNKNRYDRDKIIIYDTVNYSDDIVYTISADGVAISGTGDDVAGVFTYDKENGIDLKDNSDLANAINEAKY
ncbi:MAG: hypothetical protein IJ927_05890, partial [Eubacterium sp.]|nr:hypothetical protein [Eubacterium sp.]